MDKDTTQTSADNTFANLQADLKQNFDRNSAAFVVYGLTKRNPLSGTPYHFKVNFRLIIHQLRIDAFSTKIRERMGPLPGLLTKIIMNNSLLHGKALQVGSTEPLTLQQILSMLPANTSLDYAKLGQVLDQMVTDQLKAVRKTKQSDGEPRYSVSLSHILRFIQLRTIESIICKQFGDQLHMRVFRAIKAFTMANDKQLEESCLLSIKTVRKILIDLVVFGVVEQHEINANKGIYAYSVRVSNYLPLLRDRVFKVGPSHPEQSQPRDQDR